MRGRNTTVLQVRLQDEDYSLLKEYADFTKRDITGVIRPVILSFIDRLRGDEKVSNQGEAVKPTVYPRVGRNDPCPCGSGKKYKKCHGS